jgi:hypothetical protein
VHKNSAQCSLDANGFFSCETKESCTIKPRGAETQVQVTHSIKCSVIPCNKCASPQLKAKCCSVCLASMCGNPKSRQVCSGCDRP